ncbi:hypothetical protein O6P43_006384 [Quillaja saponaria]|uniref:Uncharacterized protein n=1 Tax=Quillaja saponaria TaxID=32244 RepID=A0AAD7VI73_QUISA|nr:hypothetical protein O6P43_006384 [Quillaja saponaria]
MAEQEMQDIIVEDPINQLDDSFENEWLSSMLVAQSQLSKNTRSTAEPRIERVPQVFLKNEGSQYNYYPRIVSFGPYHHGEPHLASTEKLKTRLMLKFISQTGKSITEFYIKIFDLVDYAGKCYVDIDGLRGRFTKREFAQMMLVDGCSILDVIDDCINSQGESRGIIIAHLGMMGYYHTFFLDMFLLENQVPFRVLLLLIRLKYKQEHEGFEVIGNFLKFIYTGVFPGKKKLEESACCSIMKTISFPPIHLLGLAARLLSEDAPEIMESSPPRWITLWKRSKAQEVEQSMLKVWTWIKFWKRETQEVEESMHLMHYSQPFPSVKELKRKGIHFKAGRSISIQEVEFKSHFCYGELTLPVMIFSPVMKVLYMNLIAFESSQNTPNSDTSVGSYFCFLNSLVDDPEDAQVLRRKRILINHKCSDKQMVEMIKEICSQMVIDLGTYMSVKEDILGHYGNKMKTWMADLIQDYFRNPWTLIAVLAAFYALFLNSVQTYWTIFRSP